MTAGPPGSVCLACRSMTAEPPRRRLAERALWSRPPGLDLGNRAHVWQTVQVASPARCVSVCVGRALDLDIGDDRGPVAIPVVRVRLALRGLAVNTRKSSSDQHQQW